MLCIMFELPHSSFYLNKVVLIWSSFYWWENWGLWKLSNDLMLLVNTARISNQIDLTPDMLGYLQYVFPGDSTDRPPTPPNFLKNINSLVKKSCAWLCQEQYLKVFLSRCCYPKEMWVHSCLNKSTMNAQRLRLTLCTAFLNLGFPIWKQCK